MRLEIADAVGAEPSTSIAHSVVELADLTGVEAPSPRVVSAASGLLAETAGLR